MTLYRTITELAFYDENILGRSRKVSIMPCGTVVSVLQDSMVMTVSGSSVIYYRLIVNDGVSKGWTAWLSGSLDDLLECFITPISPLELLARELDDED